MLFARALQFVRQLIFSQGLLLGNDASQAQCPLPFVAFSDNWDVLGPFQIGTREAPWGADPLEFYGGFRALEYSQNTTFRTSLASNGTTSWSHCTATFPDSCHSLARVNFGFPGIKWQELRDVYGWASISWQAWARGTISVERETAIVSLSADNILELRIDDEHYFGGDFYGYRRALISLRLEPGIHRIDIRLIRDIRAMGGVGEPDVDVRLQLHPSESELGRITEPNSGILVSDFIGIDAGNTLASPYGSVIVRNDAKKDMYVREVMTDSGACVAEMLASEPIKLVSGQTRPIAFRLACGEPADVQFLNGFIVVEVTAYLDGEDHRAIIASFATRPQRRKMYEPHKVTFLHPSGIVSYAILRPPSPNISRSIDSDDALPVFLGLHGAGLEADSELVRHALDTVPDLNAWVLFPTGVTPWSGDDWHVWGLADVEAAVAMIPRWIEEHQWHAHNLPRADTGTWVVTGHSNGGQGTWYMLTHWPDKVMAAAPISGYSSIQNYVPYTFWQPADPGRTSIVQSALLSYRHELLLSNAAGIPLLQQHGGDDDNVPPYHSRLMSQLSHEAGVHGHYLEVPGQPHWWTGVMTTEPLKNFYREELKAHKMRQLPASHAFTVVTANPGDTGPKYGLHILQLLIPGQLGKIEFTFDSFTGACTLKPSNVGMFQIPAALWDCDLVRLADHTIQPSTSSTNLTLIFQEETWSIQQEDLDLQFPRPVIRRNRQLGAMDAILNSHGAFQIVRPSNGTEHIALQISRNLCQYFAADTEISEDWAGAISAPGNIISVATGYDLPPSFRQAFPIQYKKPYLVLRTFDGRERVYTDVPGLGLAALYLRPLPLGRLELVVWGADIASLALAARLVPMMTGTGQPDFVIMDGKMKWKGLEGALALGFFDHKWDVSANSFVS